MLSCVTQPATNGVIAGAFTPTGTQAMTKEKKERVLHTRVPEVLEQELKRLATSLRVPVSNVVRTMLMDAVEAANVVGERAEGELRGAAARLNEHRAKLRQQTTDALRAGIPLPQPIAPTPTPRRDQSAATASPAAPSRQSAAPAVQAARPPLASVVGFQSILMARDLPCALCGKPLRAGEQGFLGLTTDGSPPPIVGSECLPFAHKPAEIGAGEKK